MPSRLLLIYMIDALGYTQAGEESFLPFLEVHRAPVRSVLGYSSAAIPTIMTGRLPAEHGHFAMYRRAGRDGVFRSLKPLLQIAGRLNGSSWRVRRGVTRYLRARGITGYFSLYEIPLGNLAEFDLCQRRNLYAPGAFKGVEGLADLLGENGASRVWNWSVEENLAFRELEAEVERGERRVLFLYSSALDSVMHAAGPDGDATRARLRDYERRIREAVQKARSRYREVKVAVFGDHGMAPVRGAHDLWTPLKRLGLRVPSDFLFFLDSTMARFWFGNETARARVHSLLRDTRWGRIVPEEETRALGVFFPDAAYGETLFLMNEGEILVPSFMGRERVAGMHGYHPDGAHSDTTLATNIESAPYPKDLISLHAFLRREIEEALR